MDYRKFLSLCCESRAFFRAHIKEAKEALIFEELLAICRIHALNPTIVQ